MTGLFTGAAVQAFAHTRAACAAGRRRARVARARARGDDRGEGVVSAAIVVLIMAAIGALMWVGFRTMWTDIESKTNDNIAEVGE